MPEAVIVATARSPDRPRLQGLARRPPPRRPGRDDRPGRAGQGPAARPAHRQRPDHGLRPAGRRAGLQHRPGRRRASSASTTSRVRRSRATAPRSLQSTRMAFHAIKAGEGDVFISAGVEMVSRFVKGNSDSPARHPGLRRSPTRRARVGEDGRGQLPLDRPARGRQPPRRLHRDGADRGERRAAQGHLPRRSRTSSASGRRTSPRRRSPTASGSGRSPRSTTPNGVVVDKDDGPRAGVTLEGVSGAQAGLPPGRHRHGRQLLPAQRRRRRGDHHERHQGQGARHSRRWPGSSRPAVSGLSPEIMGLGPIEATEARAGASRQVHRRHRPGRDQRGVRRPGHPVGARDRASTRSATSSTSTAARSPSATRSG